jgi:hypothetical protein
MASVSVRLNWFRIFPTLDADRGPLTRLRAGG